MSRQRPGILKRQEQQRNRRLVIALVIIAIIIALAKITTAVTGRSNPVDRAITAITSPVVYVMVRIGEGVSSLRHIFTIPSTLAENRRLSEENQMLLRSEDESAQLRAENERLRKQLGIDMQPGFTKLNAVVLSRPYDLWVESAIISAGRSDGVRKGNLVVNEYGVVGRISEVSQTFSRVELISSPQFKIGTIAGTGRAEGVVEGRNPNRCRLESVSTNANITVGEKVFTRGEQSVMLPAENGLAEKQGNDQPRGVFIGTIITRSTDESGFMTIEVEPAANTNRLGTVTVYAK